MPVVPVERRQPPGPAKGLESGDEASAGPHDFAG